MKDKTVHYFAAVERGRVSTIVGDGKTPEEAIHAAKLRGHDVVRVIEAPLLRKANG